MLQNSNSFVAGGVQKAQKGAQGLAHVAAPVRKAGHELPAFHCHSEYKLESVCLNRTFVLMRSYLLGDTLSLVPMEDWHF